MKKYYGLEIRRKKNMTETKWNDQVDLLKKKLNEEGKPPKEVKQDDKVAKFTIPF